MNRIVLVIVSLTVAVLVAAGCGGKSAVAPNLDIQTEKPQVQSDRMLWGLYHCYMRPGDDQIQVELLRGASFTANVNNILEAKPGNLLIEDMDLTDFQSEGRLDCTIRLRHPFPGLEQYHGFDVCGVFMHNGSKALNYDALSYGEGSGENEAILLNPDGWTRWFNFTEFDGDGLPILEYWPGKLSNLPDQSATLNPYKAFADSLENEDSFYDWATAAGNLDNRGIFSAGVVNSRRYELDFPIVGGSPVVDFQYAVVASWEPGDPTLTGGETTYEPFDFPTSANCEEAFLLSTVTSESDLYYDVDTSEAGGTFKARVEVFDWQGGIVGNAGVPNEVYSIIVEGDFLPGGSYQLDKTQLAAVAAPATENSSVFQVEVAGCSPQASGESKLWVIVEADGQRGGSYGQGFPVQYPEPARRTAFMPGVVAVAPNSPVPEAKYHWEFDDIATFHSEYPAGYADYDDLGPAIIEESDGDIGLTWNSNERVDIAPWEQSWWLLRRSTDNGVTYGYDGYSDGGANITREDHAKIASDGNGWSYAVSRFGQENRLAYICRVEPVWPTQRGVFVSQADRDIEVVVDADGYVYAFDDQYGGIGVKHSQGPYMLDPWTWHEPPYVRFSVAPGAYCSHVRSAGVDSSGVVWLAYYSLDEKQIKLARSTDASPHEAWNSGTIVYTGGSGITEVKNPGLFIDSSDLFHICYTRFDGGSGKYQLVYVKDTSDFASPEEQVIYESDTEISDAHLSIGSKFDAEVIAFMFETDQSVWLVTLVNGTAIGPVEEVDGSTNDIDPDVILDADQCDLHSVWATEIGGNYEIARRNGVLIKE